VRTSQNDGKREIEASIYGEPTYWPSDRNQLPDLLDVCVTKDIPQDFAVAKSCCDLSSDHSPILITPTADALNQENEPILRNRNTNWNDFRRLVNERLTSNIPLKTEEDIEAAGWNATAEHKGAQRILLPYNNWAKIRRKKKVP
jgi:hypothetical protein